MKKLKKKKYDLYEDMKGKPFYELLHFFADAVEPLSKKELKIIRKVAKAKVSEDHNYQRVIDAVNHCLANKFDLWLELCDNPAHKLRSYLYMTPKPIDAKTLRVLHDIAKFNYKIDKNSYGHVLKDIELFGGPRFDTDV